MADKTVTGLVLAGGLSKRMGADKGLIKYHLRPERYRIYSILEKLCGRAFLSIGPAQTKEIQGGYKCIVDNKPGLGPMAAIAAALSSLKTPIFVLPTDTPAMDEAAAKALLRAYASIYTNAYEQQDMDAFLFASSAQAVPEPVMGIWEPSALPTLEAALERNERSLVKQFSQLKIQTYTPRDPYVLTNANDPSQQQEMRNWLKHKQLDEEGGKHKPNP